MKVAEITHMKMSGFFNKMSDIADIPAEFSTYICIVKLV
jgi:hypothetical protein